MSNEALPLENDMATSETISTGQKGVYAGLDVLSEHFGRAVDVLAVSSTGSTGAARTKGTKNDYHTMVTLIDQTLPVGEKIQVDIFRPERLALPITQQGDVVILHNFRVRTSNHCVELVSTWTSSWVVFRRPFSLDSINDCALMSGPPCEYGRFEEILVAKLASWWEESYSR